MGVSAVIINSPNCEKNEWIGKIPLKEVLKKMSSKSFQPELNIIGIDDYTNGIKVSFYCRELYDDGKPIPGYDEEKEEKASMYMFDDGQIYFVNLGQRRRFFEPYEDAKVEQDYTNISSISNKLDEKLGPKYEEKRLYESNNFLKEFIADLTVNDHRRESNKELRDFVNKRRTLLIEKTKQAIKNNGYEESTFDFNPITNKIVERKKESKVEWCRKAKYNVQIELGCYKIDETHPLLEGFEAKDFERDGVVSTYAVKSGTNELEQNSWTTNPDRPYIITGTVGERWPVKPSNLSAYDVNVEDIGVEPITVSTKDPDNQEFLKAVRIPLDKNVKVISKWAYRDDGTIDESQVLVTNSPDSKVSHADGDWIVYKYVPGKPDYMDLPKEIQNTKEAATIYSPRVINGSVMNTTYDHDENQENIINIYKNPNGFTM